MLNKIIGITVLACILCFGRARAKDASDLFVGITSNCASYGLQDDIALHVEISNRGALPVTLYGKLGWGESGGVTLKITKMTGEAVRPKSLDDDMIIPSTLDDHNYYATVFRHQFIGFSRNERVAELFPFPGQYKVQVEYLSPVPAASSLIKHSFWSREKGKVASNVIVLTIGQMSTCKIGLASEKKADASLKLYAYANNNPIVQTIRLVIVPTLVRA